MAEEHLGELQRAARSLRAEARNYVITGKEEYAESFRLERNQKRTRETAVNNLLTMGLMRDEIILLQDIKRLSDQLVDLEMNAIAARQSSLKTSPLKPPLFTDDYLRDYQIFEENIEILHKNIQERLHAEVYSLNKKVNQSIAVALIFLALNLLTISTVLLGFYKNRVLRPLTQLTQKANLLLQGKHDLDFNNAIKAQELIDLATALTNYQEAIKKIEQDRSNFERSEKWYRQIIESNPDGLLVVDETGSIRLANPAAHDIFQYPPRELLNKSVEILVPLDIRDRHPSLRTEFMSKDSSVKMGQRLQGFRGVRRDGVEFPLDLSITQMPKLNDHGKSVCIAARDVSERKGYEKKLADQIEFQQTLLDTIPYPIFYKDRQAVYRGFNQAFLNYFKVNETDLLGKSVLEFMKLPEKDRPMYQENNTRVLQEGGSFTTEIDIPDGEGVNHPMIYRIVGFSDSDGNPAGLVGVIVDISQQKTSEASLAKAKQLAEEATQLKSDFLANMSHEIRTPMNVIMGMCHLTLQTDLTEKQRNFISKAYGSAQNLLGIINDILDFSKIESGKLSIEKVDFQLEEVLSSVADLALVKAGEKGLEFIFDIAVNVPTGLIGDSMRLNQILVNLVGNAIKFTEQGEVTLGIRLKSRNRDCVVLRFEITDTGIGISETQQLKLFQAFTQADSSTSRRFGGTGLGLTICKNLVHIMGGEIGVSSEPGKGSSFWFTLPMQLQAEQVRPHLEDDELQDISVLVVDDNRSTCEIFANMLETMGFHATAVESGEEAIRAVSEATSQDTPFGVVLMDWMMPGMDGVEALKQICQATSAEKLPSFVMTTAYNKDELVEALGDMPVSDILTKPVTPSALLNSLLSATGKSVIKPLSQDQQNADLDAAQNALRGAHLLLVEDNELNREMMIELLTQVDITVDSASNGAEALIKVMKCNYDGVLMDCQMPLMDGYEATTRMRAQESLQNLPIIAMTANAMEEDRRKCLEVGMNDHVAKPIDVSKLFMTLYRWVKPSHPVLITRPQANNRVSTELTEVEGLDIQSALARLGGNQNLLHKLINRFIETQAGTVLLAQNSVDKGNTELATRTLHTLKGLAGNIGADTLSKHCAELNSDLKQGKLDERKIGERFASLNSELHEIIEKLGALRSINKQQVPKHDSAPSNSQEIGNSIAELESLLNTSDIQAVALIEKVAPVISAAGFSDYAESLQSAIERYDFDTAGELLEKLRRVIPDDAS